MTTELSMGREVAGGVLQKPSGCKLEGLWASNLCWFACKSGAGGIQWLDPTQPENQLPWANPALPTSGHRLAQDIPCWAEHTAQYFISTVAYERKTSWNSPLGKALHFIRDQTGDYREAQTCSKPTKQKAPQGQMGKSSENKMWYTTVSIDSPRERVLLRAQEERALRHVCTSIHPASGPESALWATGWTGNASPAVMTTHWTPPCMSWGLTSDTSTDRRRPVTNTEESSWELTLVSSSKPRTNGTAKFYLPLCHDSISGAHIRGQHTELVREPRPPPVNRVQLMPAEDEGPFQGPRDVLQKTILHAYIPLPSSPWTEFRVQEGITTRKPAPNWQIALGVSPEWASSLVIFLRLKPQWYTQESKMFMEIWREQIGGRGPGDRKL